MSKEKKSIRSSYAERIKKNKQENKSSGGQGGSTDKVVQQPLFTNRIGLYLLLPLKLRRRVLMKVLRGAAESVEK